MAALPRAQDRTAELEESNRKLSPPRMIAKVRHVAFDVALLQMPLFLLLLASAAVFEAQQLSSLSSLTGGDIWWHLQTGLWILQNHALPHNGIYSQATNLPWTAASWSYDLLVAVGYKLLGLRSLPVLLMCFKVLLAAATFLLAGGLRGAFWAAAALSAVAQYVLGSVPLGSGNASILLFAVELLLLHQSRRKSSAGPLFWLPLVFLIWVNLDVQFVYGILLLALFSAVALVEQFGRSSEAPQLQRWPATSPLSLGTPLALSLLATFFTPYFYRPYGIFFARITSTAIQYFPDFHAMSFHRPQDYVLLLLAMAAFLALGLRRSRDPFQIGVLAGCAILSFHAQRDTWAVALASIAVLAEASLSNARTTGQDVNPGTSEAPGKGASRPLLYAVLTSPLVLAVFLFAVSRIPGHDALLAKIGQSYPVEACDFIREHGLPRPLFNTYEWGGFLMWYLPTYPVAIDGRTDLYGDDFNTTYAKVMAADLPYTTFPAMTQAGTLLLRRNSLMADALSTLPHFKVAHSDNVAVVLLPQE